MRRTQILEYCLAKALKEGLEIAIVENNLDG
jgi:hypothetical protein